MARSTTLWLYTPNGLKLMDPTPLRARLNALRFDGESGIVKSERDDILRETRFDYLLTKKRVVSFREYDGDFVDREIPYQSVYNVKLRFNSGLDLLVVECTSSTVASEVVDSVAAALGCTFELQTFDAISMKKLLKMAEDIRKVSIYGIDDPFLGEAQLKGSALNSSKRFKELSRSGKIRELVARVSLPSGAHTVVLNSGGKMRVTKAGGTLDKEDVFELLKRIAD